MQPRSIRPSTVAVFLWIALIGPVARSIETPGASAILVLVTVGGGAAAIIVTRPTHWVLRLVLAVGFGGALAPTQGEAVALWATAGLLLAAWAAQARPPLPVFSPPGRETIVPVVALCGVAAWVGAAPETTWQPIVPFLLAIMAVASPLGHRMALAGDVVGSIASIAVSRVAFLLVGALVVVVPWVAQQLHLLTRFDDQSGWARRDQPPVDPERLWERETAPRGSSKGVRRARVLAWGVVGGVGIVALLLARGWSPFDAGSSAGTQASPADGPSWYREYREDISWVLDERVALRPFEVYRLLDVRTRHVNIEDGERESWAPPPCDCDRLQVWLYGGSPAFGMEQRDEHTVASEFARIAAENGIAMDVHNRGIPGQLHWRAALRFGWDLATEAAPDMAIFYDGAEDVAAAVQLTGRDLGDTKAPYEPYIEDLYDAIYDVVRPLPPPPGVEALGWPPAPNPVPAQTAGQLAAGRYDRSREISRNTAAQHGIPIHYVWHPSRRAATGQVDPFLDASQHLPGDVLDLTDLLAGESVTFADDVHVGERGARAVAEVLFDELESQVRALTDGGDRP